MSPVEQDKQSLTEMLTNKSRTNQEPKIYKKDSKKNKKQKYVFKRN